FEGFSGTGIGGFGNVGGTLFGGGTLGFPGAGGGGGGVGVAGGALDAEEDEADRELIRTGIARLGELRDRVEAQAAAVDGDLARAVTQAAGRLAGMQPAERKAFDREMRILADDLEELLARIRRADEEVAQLQGQRADITLRDTADKVVALVSEISGAVDEMSLIQARARVESIAVTREQLDPDVAFEIARANRLDWMNARAALVDQWRLIQYNAVKLLADLDLKLEGDISTTGNNAARFRAPTGSLSAGVQFDPPLTRLQERNSWRQAILQYQQQRRRQIRFEDDVKLKLRQLLRQLELDRLNLEEQRRAVVIAVRRVDETRLTLGQPAAPPPAPGPDGTFAAGTATDRLGPTTIINYVTATNALRSSQDALTSVWLRYYQTRALLARELGVMELADDGLWIDKPLCLADKATDDDPELPPPVPQEWLEHLEEVKSPPPLGADADGKPAAEGKPPAEPLPAPAADTVE
ncbi:MAG: hypothetical protein ACKOHG_15615, partial [Planctomycetia bacterium]